MPKNTSLVSTREHEAGDTSGKFHLSKERWLQLFSLVFTLAVCVLIVIFRNSIEGIGGYGYIGAFLVAVLSCATIVVPVPGLIVVFTLGAVLNPLLIGLVSGLGGTLGEMTGYLLGYGGRGAVENINLYQRMESLMKRWGALTLFVLALVPNPLFDIAGAAAGALRFPLWKFLVYGGAGRTIKYTAFAYAGAWGVDFILRLLG
ncbi:VTT domain-containing protein [Chloroflexota bacterium]